MKIYFLGSKKESEILRLIGIDLIDINEYSTIKELRKFIKSKRESIAILLMSSHTLEIYDDFESYLSKQDIAWTLLPSDKKEADKATQSLEAVSEKVLGMKINIK